MTTNHHVNLFTVNAADLVELTSRKIPASVIAPVGLRLNSESVVMLKRNKGYGDDL